MNKKLLREYVRAILSEKTSALKSEVNLKDAINRAVDVAGGEIELNIGDFGSQTVTGAAKAGGGNPEPKADIIILTKENPEGLGISMKAPNYDFIQNRMQTTALNSLLTSIGVPDKKKVEIVEKLKLIVKDATEEKEENIKRQHDDFFKAIEAWDGDYSFPDKLWKEIKDENSDLRDELIKTGSWSRFSKTESGRYDNTQDAISTISIAGDTLKWYVSIVK